MRFHFYIRLYLFHSEFLCSYSYKNTGKRAEFDLDRCHRLSKEMFDMLVMLRKNINFV